MNTTTPDCEGLVRLLSILRVLPDALGWTRLTDQEALKIRSLGFLAKPGPWKVPALPPDLTRDNPLLEPLSAGWKEGTSLDVMPEGQDNCATGAASKPRDESQVRSRLPVAPNKVSDEPHQGGEHSVFTTREEPELAQIEKAASKIEETLKRAGRPIPKRRLQQLLWRFPARVFNPALRMAERRYRILLEVK